MNLNYLELEFKHKLECPEKHSRYTIGRDPIIEDGRVIELKICCSECGAHLWTVKYDEDRKTYILNQGR